MISWIEGKLIEKWNQNSKKIAIVVCGGIGYEILILNRLINIIKLESKVNFWIHQVNREDAIILYGFEKRVERDFFRKIITVNGIGPKIAMSLLDNCSINDLWDAISNKDIERLIKCPGVGKRMAERLSVELKNKIDDLTTDIPPITISKDTNSYQKENQLNTIKDDLKETLKSLSYDEKEINLALSNVLSTSIHSHALNNKVIPIDTTLFDEILKEILLELNHKHSSKGT